MKISTEVVRTPVSMETVGMRHEDTAETRLIESLKASDELLTKRGVKHVIFESPETAHEWHTWRRHLNNFAPRLFQ